MPISPCAFTYLSQTGWRSVFIPTAVRLPDEGHNLDVAYLPGRIYIDRIQDSEAGSKGTQCTSFLFAIGDQQRISSTGEINKWSQIVNLRTGN